MLVDMDQLLTYQKWYQQAIYFDLKVSDTLLKTKGVMVYFATKLPENVPLEEEIHLQIINFSASMSLF